jgi:GNAT superfamily N-acetyltransferase
MCWHQTRAEWNRNKGAKNKRLMKAMVARGEVPGLIAYRNRAPVGWCSIMPRESYVSLRRSPMLKTVDRPPAWSVPCFFIAPKHRRTGVAVELLRAAARYARSHGATLLEGYPVIARKGKMPDAFAWTGLLPIFERAGFQERARLSASRAIVRLELGGSQHG